MSVTQQWGSRFPDYFLGKTPEKNYVGRHDFNNNKERKMRQVNDYMSEWVHKLLWTKVMRVHSEVFDAWCRACKMYYPSTNNFNRIFIYV